MADDMAPVGHPIWPCRASRLAVNLCKTIAKSLQNQTGAKWGQTGGPTGQTGCPTGGQRRPPHLATNYCKTIAKPLRIIAKPDGGQTGWRMERLFTFKRKNDMFCIRVM
jgi:hypothetical protein